MMKSFRVKLMAVGVVRICRPSGPVLPDFRADGTFGGGTTSVVIARANGKDADLITNTSSSTWQADFEDVPTGTNVPLYAEGNDGASDQILITVSQSADGSVTWSCVEAAPAEDSPEAAKHYPKGGKVLCDAMEFRIPRPVNPNLVALRFVTSQAKYSFQVKGVLTRKAKSVTVQAGDQKGAVTEGKGKQWTAKFSGLAPGRYVLKATQYDKDKRVIGTEQVLLRLGEEIKE